MGVNRELPRFLNYLGRALNSGSASGISVQTVAPEFQRRVAFLAGVASKSKYVPLGHVRFFSGLPPHTVLTMPSLSPTMTQGNITKWKKQVGDEVAPGHVYAEVETDKATIEWESQEEGFIAKFLKPEGSKDIALGEPVAIIVEEKESIAAFKDYVPGGKPAAAPAKPATPAAPPKPAAAASSWPPHQVMNMPALSPTMHTGNITEWKKKVGDSVAPGDMLCEVETDKSTIAWEAQEEGYIAAILVPSGTKDIALGTPVAILVDEKDLVAKFANFTSADVGGSAPAPSAPASKETSSTPTPTAPPTPSTQAKPAASASRSEGDRVKASPYAKKLASEHGLHLSSVPATGPNGRIIAADITTALQTGAGKAPTPTTTTTTGGVSAPVTAGVAVPEGGFVDIPHTMIRRITAQRLLESKTTIPHYYLSMEVQVDKMLSLREVINKQLASSKNPSKISVNDFIVKASALALKRSPAVNSAWFPEFIRQYDNVDISVAVQTPIGLMVPIVRDADKKGLAGISGEVKTLAAKAKEGKLQPHEFTGGTFTISNLGMFGIKSFAAIVNPPQAAILAVGGTDKKVVVNKDGTYSEVSTMIVTLSCDHRVVDGAVGAEWLQAFKGFIEEPFTMML